MNKPHVHAELIKAWADGAEIECWSIGLNKWVGYNNENPTPQWRPSMRYRIKPAKITRKQAQEAWFQYWGMPPRVDPDMALVEKFLFQEE